MDWSWEYNSNLGLIGFILFIACLVGYWRMFVKMGRSGWEGFIPIYNIYILFKVLYGKGWKIILFLIPIYDIYLMFKYSIDLAHAFGKGTGFGVAMVFFPSFCTLILGFGSATYVGPAAIG